MLRFLDNNRKNSLAKLEIILNKRKFIQKKETSTVKNIIANVKKMEIKQL